MSHDIDRSECMNEPTGTLHLADLLDQPAVTSDHVHNLRRARFPLGLGALDEAEAMFAVERSPAEKSKQWSELFIELVTDFIVWGERPTGAVNNERAEWVLAQVDLRRSPVGIALLVNIIDEAQLVPRWFAEAVRNRAVRVFESVEDDILRRQAA